MPESSDKSRSRKKKGQQPKLQDQQVEQSTSIGSTGKPESVAPNSSGEMDLPAEELENTEERPGWLFELESKAISLPDETNQQESNPKVGHSGEEIESNKTGGESAQNDLPDWLKQDHIIKPPASQQNVPEDELPDWLKQGLEDLSSPLEDSGDLAHAEDSGTGEDEQGQSSPSITEETTTEETALVAQELQDNEPLAKVRLALKDAEQSKEQEDHSGLLTKMTGWILASSHAKRDSSEQDLEDETGAMGAEYSKPVSEEQLEDVPSDISAELLASRLGEFTSDAQEDDEALNETESPFFLDEFDEILAEEGEVDDVYATSVEGEAEITGDEQPIDQELRQEILSEIETSNQGQTPQSAGEEKRGKGFLKGLFASKKADSSQKPTISDEEIERRLLIGLSASAIAESQLNESPSPTPGEAMDETEPGLLFLQEEEADSSFQADYMDEETYLEEQGAYYPSDFEETDHQLDEAESPTAEIEQDVYEEAPEGAEAGASYTELRELALQDFVEAPPQPEAGPVSTFIQKTTHQIEELSPLQKISLGILFIVDIGFIALLAGILVLSNFTPAVAPPTAPPAPTVRIDAPFPTQVILPGGWSFTVTPGTLREGLWENQGAEWLQGTEITRWVALPWSKQLETVVVTFGPDEQIELVMSNLDRVKYKVESVQEVPVAKVRELNLNTPSLLLILANKDSDRRVVVIGSLVSDE
jgi:hypothetical protein